MGKADRGEENKTLAHEGSEGCEERQGLEKGCAGNGGWVNGGWVNGGQGSGGDGENGGSQERGGASTGGSLGTGGDRSTSLVRGWGTRAPNAGAGGEGVEEGVGD